MDALKWWNNFLILDAWLLDVPKRHIKRSKPEASRSNFLLMPKSEEGDRIGISKLGHHSNPQKIKKDDFLQHHWTLPCSKWM